MSSAKKQIFLSYADADRDWAEAIAKGLTHHRFNVWYDAWEVFPGDNRALRVGHALENSKAMLVLISPQSLDSSEVTAQVQYALGSVRFEHALIPVVIKASPRMPWILRQMRFVKATAPEETVHEIVRALEEIKISVRHPVS